MYSFPSDINLNKISKVNLYCLIPIIFFYIITMKKDYIKVCQQGNDTSVKILNISHYKYV